MGNMGGIGDLMKQAQKMADEAKKIEEELGAQRVEGSSGGGMVRVVATGNKEILDITIDPQVVDPEDVEMLQDLVVTAVREALEQVDKLRESKIGALTGGMGLPKGLGIPGFG